MKTNAKNVLTLKFYQTNGTEVVTTFTLEPNSKNSLLVGTALNELFTLQSNYRKANLRLFKSSEPVLFMVKRDDETLLNIGNCQRYIIDKLKFNKTPKSMKTFSKRVNLAVTEMSRNILVIDYSKIEQAIDSIAE